MCRFLKVTRSSVYYEHKGKKNDTAVENAVVEEFRANWGVYGTRKLKRALKRRKTPLTVSRRKIGVIMRKYGLESKYTTKRSKRRKGPVNEEHKPDLVKREFGGRTVLEVVVSDVTYVKVGTAWHYICLITDISAREIIGFAAGREKSSKLIRTAFYRIRGDLRDIRIFHTDRGSEFKNEVVDTIVSAFGIERSLSAKGSPIDNAVAESMYNVLKTEMILGVTFDNLDEMELKLFEYVNWYNNRRLHGSLGYIPPAEYKLRLKECN